MRIHNFNAGPAALPLPVLEQVQRELLELPRGGMSVMELSHRSKEFEAIRDRAENGLRGLMNIPDDYTVLFLQGGASLQFSMIPMNLLGDGDSADYIVHGSWGEKALKEALKEGTARVAASTKEFGYKRVPHQSELNLDPNAKYVHLTTNETIEGVQWAELPDTNGVPIVADMSSDILSYPLDFSKFGLIYAGAQKNIGPSGVTVVIIKNDWIEKKSNLATMLDYSTHAKENSLFNTPNTFGIYMIALVCEYLEKLGGLDSLQMRAHQKASMLYALIDSSSFYHGFADMESRSKMNVTFRLPNEELETKFVVEAVLAGFAGLKGHRSVGGIRASIYNAVETESVRELVSFMREFERLNS
jgi:phosphoserine aminotransferase